MMNDPSNFGMAKSIFMMGQEAGFDMTTRDGSDAFMLAYNTQLGQQLPSGTAMPESPLPDTSWRLDPAERKRRKRAEEALKRSRKRRK